MKRFSSLFLSAILLTITSMNMAQTKEVIGYFPEWGVNYKPYYVKNIETSGAAELITVINYSFGIPKADSLGNMIVSLESPYLAYGQVYSADISIDGFADDSTQALRGHFNQLKKLKKRHPQIRIVVSLGGWLGSLYFSDAAKTPESRESFVNSCLSFFIHGNLPTVNGAGGESVAEGIFDGIDIDWEYPISGGAEGIVHDPNDNNNLTELYKLFRKKMDQINPELLLTSAVPAIDPVAYNYNHAEDIKYLDWLMLMTYDFFGGWDKTTGHHTNLLESKYESGFRPKKRSLHKTVQKFLYEFGIPKEKLIAGAGFYGRGWKEVGEYGNGLTQTGTIADGIYEQGHNYWSDLIMLTEKGYKMYWDETALSHWLYSNDEKSFWTLEDEQSTALKGRYAEAYDLGGKMFWDLSGDDEKGTLITAYTSGNMGDIELPTNSESSAKQVIFSFGANTKLYKEGSIVIINIENSEDYKRVEFLVDDKSIGLDTQAPFNWAYFNAKEGKHKVSVKAWNESGKVSGASAEIKVKPANSAIFYWQEGNSYKIGDQIYYKGFIYECIEDIELSTGLNAPNNDADFWMLFSE